MQNMNTRTIASVEQLKQVTDETIRQMVQAIADQFQPERILLFGSYARGNARPGSDVDLLLVMPIEGSRRKKRVQIGLSLYEYRVPVDIVIVTPQEFETDARIAGTIVRPAVREGKVMYVRQ